MDLGPRSFLDPFQRGPRHRVAARQAIRFEAAVRDPAKHTREDQDRLSARIAGADL